MRVYALLLILLVNFIFHAVYLFLTIAGE